MGKNYNGTQISQSVTVSEVAGATVEDCRNKIFVYDENGKAKYGYIYGKTYNEAKQKL